MSSNFIFDEDTTNSVENKTSSEFIFDDEPVKTSPGFTFNGGPNPTPLPKLSPLEQAKKDLEEDKPEVPFIGDNGPEVRSQEEIRKERDKEVETLAQGEAIQKQKEAEGLPGNLKRITGGILTDANILAEQAKKDVVGTAAHQVGSLMGLVGEGVTAIGGNPEVAEGLKAYNKTPTAEYFNNIADKTTKSLEEQGVPQPESIGEKVSTIGAEVVLGGGPRAIKGRLLKEPTIPDLRDPELGAPSTHGTYTPEGVLANLPENSTVTINGKTASNQISLEQARDPSPEVSTQLITSALKPKKDVYTSTSLSSNIDELETQIQSGKLDTDTLANTIPTKLSENDLISGYTLFEDDPVMMAYYAQNSTMRVGDNVIDTYVREVPNKAELDGDYLFAVEKKPLTRAQKITQSITSFLKYGGTGSDKLGVRRKATSTAMVLNKYALARDLQRHMEHTEYGPIFVGRRDVMPFSNLTRLEVYHDAGANAKKSIVHSKDDFVLEPTYTEDGGIINQANTEARSWYKSLDEAGVVEGTPEYNNLMNYMVAKDNLDTFNLNNKRIVDLKLKQAANPMDKTISAEIKALQEYKYDGDLDTIFDIVKRGDTDPTYVKFSEAHRVRNTFMAKLLNRSGKLTDDGLKNILAARPNFMPNKRLWESEDPSLMDDSFENIFGVKTTNAPDAIKKRAGENTNVRAEPGEAYVQYLERAMDSSTKANINRASLNFYLQLPDDQWSIFFRESKQDVINTLYNLGRIGSDTALAVRNQVFSLSDLSKFPKDRTEFTQRINSLNLSPRDKLLLEQRTEDFATLINDYGDRVRSGRSPLTEVVQELDDKIKKLTSSATTTIERTDVTKPMPGKAISPDTVTFDIGQNKVELTIQDPELFRYFQGSAPMYSNRGSVLKALSLFSSATRNLIILNPEFSLMIHSRETQDALAYTSAANKLSKKLLGAASYPGSIANRFTYVTPELRGKILETTDMLFGTNKYEQFSENMAAFKANYGAHASFEGVGPTASKTLIGKGYDGLTNVAARFDMAPRMWLYDNLIKQGYTKVEAQQMANNMGVNFMQEGIPLSKTTNSKTLRDYTSSVYFLTAGLNGLYRTLGAYRYEPKMMAGAVATVAGYYGAIEAWNQTQINPQTGKPFIDELPEDLRNSKLIVMLPNAVSKDDYMKFGIGFAIGPAAKLSVNTVKSIHNAAVLSLSENIKSALNGSIIELEEFKTPEQREAFKNEIASLGLSPEDIARHVLNTASQTFSVPATAGQYQPFFDIASKEQARTGFAFEGKGRYDYIPTTSPTIKYGVDKFNDTFGTNVSPKITDSTIKSLTALAGKSMLDLSDYLYVSRLQGQELPAMTTRDIPIARGFMGNVDGSARSNTDMLYYNMSSNFFNPLAKDLADAEKNNDTKAEDGLNQLYSREIELLKYKKTVDEQISAINAEKKRMIFPETSARQLSTPEIETFGDPVMRQKINDLDEQASYLRESFVRNVLTSTSKDDIIKFGKHYNRPFSIIQISPGYSRKNENINTKSDVSRDDIIPNTDTRPETTNKSDFIFE